MASVITPVSFTPGDRKTFMKYAVEKSATINCTITAMEYMS